MNWIKQTFEYFGWLSSSDKQPLQDDFHNGNETNSSSDSSSKSSDRIETIKTFVKKYPISVKDARAVDVNSGSSTQETSTLVNSQHVDRRVGPSPEATIQSQCDGNFTSTLLEEVNLQEDTIDILESSVCTPEVPQVPPKDKKKSKRIKKVKKRVTWAVRRSWKWIKRGWSGYAPGVASGLMYCSNAPTTIFHIYGGSKK